MRASIISTLALCLSACNTEQYEPINIAVYPSTMSCTIKDRPLNCAELPTYLSQTLKTPANKEITISFAGSETVTPENKSLERIAELIRKAGYTQVKVIRFDL